MYDNTNPIKEQFMRIKYQMFVNQKLREDFAASLLNAKEQLSDVNHQRERFEVISEHQVKRYQSDVPPRPIYDFY